MLVKERNTRKELSTKSQNNDISAIFTAGFQINSFVDWPGKIVSVVFLGGCNFRCHYCHNHNILGAMSNTIPFTEVLEQIKGQIGFIDGVVISGGEPTLHQDLLTIIKEIRKLGFAVKLDTNGTDSKLLEKLVNEKLVDYIAMDVKGPLDRYPDIVSVQTALIAEVEKSIKYLKAQHEIDYMFRMTLSPMLTEEDIKKTALLAAGAKCFQLQQFVPNEYSNSFDTVLLPYSCVQAEKFGTIFKKHVNNFIMRGF